MEILLHPTELLDFVAVNVDLVNLKCIFGGFGDKKIMVGNVLSVLLGWWGEVSLVRAISLNMASPYEFSTD